LQKNRQSVSFGPFWAQHKDGEHNIKMSQNHNHEDDDLLYELLGVCGVSGGVPGLGVLRKDSKYNSRTLAVQVMAALD
jgi:hypothetical protein